MALISLFVHVLHWAVYELIAFSIWFAAVTPLVICLIYHLLQTDCQETFNISRKQIFIGTVAVPLLVAAVISVIVFVNNPSLGVYSSGGQLSGSFIEKIAIYSGRIVISALYLLLFSIIDIPLLRFQDQRRYLKKSSQLTPEDLAEKQVYVAPDAEIQEEDL